MITISGIIQKREESVVPMMFHWTSVPQDVSTVGKYWVEGI